MLFSYKNLDRVEKRQKFLSVIINYCFIHFRRYLLPRMLILNDDGNHEAVVNA